MKKRKTYSREVAERIDKALPPKVVETLNAHGWNALGVYELVKEVLAEERKKPLS